MTLVKNPGMRYRSGGPFADAVAAVRAGRRPPRPSQATPAGRASPAAIPSGAQARVAANPTGRAPAARRSRPTSGGHRTPPPRRTFSSGQRALLWAAGVLGALAIIIAVLIVINSHDNAQPQPSAPTVTDTGTPGGSAPAQPSDWTDRGVTGNPGRQSKQPEYGRTAAPAYHRASLPRHETSQ
ncbi:MAG: serine/threonine protein kinase, partial [Mycobacterium sp.]